MQSTEICTVLAYVVYWKRIDAAFKNLGRLQTKIFTSDIQFNVLQHDTAFGIESETLNMQFNVVQHDRSAFWVRQKIEFNWLNTNVPAYSEICIRAKCESFVPFDTAFSATYDSDENLMRAV